MDATAASSHTLGMSGWKARSPAPSAATARRAMPIAQTVLLILAPVGRTEVLACTPIFVPTGYHAHKDLVRPEPMGGPWPPERLETRLLTKLAIAGLQAD